LKKFITTFNTLGIDIDTFKTDLTNKIEKNYGK